MTTRLTQPLFAGHELHCIGGTGYARLCHTPNAMDAVPYCCFEGQPTSVLARAHRIRRALCQNGAHARNLWETRQDPVGSTPCIPLHHHHPRKHITVILLLIRWKHVTIQESDAVCIQVSKMTSVVLAAGLAKL